MAKLSRDRKSGVLHPREALLIAGNLAAVNAEIVLDCDGCGAVLLDLRGTFNLTIELQGTVDGTNWMLIPVRNKLGGHALLASIVGSTAGIWTATCAGFDKIRARVSAYTSGSVTATLVGSSIQLDEPVNPRLVTTSIGTAVGAAAAAVTLTLASPGAGLRHYLTYLAINRFASALLTAAAAPVTVTTTNLPGSLAFSFPAEAAAQGTIDRYREDFAVPIAAVAQATNTTIVCPATTAVIWRVTAGFFNAP